MASRKKSTRFNSKNSGNYSGWSSRDAHLVSMSVGNDSGLNAYVKKNKKSLLSLNKDDKLSLIKKNARCNWSKSDLRGVRPENIKASELNQIIRR